MACWNTTPILARARHARHLRGPLTMRSPLRLLGLALLTAPGRAGVGERYRPGLRQQREVQRYLGVRPGQRLSPGQGHRDLAPAARHGVQQGAHPAPTPLRRRRRHRRDRRRHASRWFDQIPTGRSPETFDPTPPTARSTWRTKRTRRSRSSTSPERSSSTRSRPAPSRKGLMSPRTRRSSTSPPRSPTWSMSSTPRRRRHRQHHRRHPAARFVMTQEGRICGCRMSSRAR